jgi:MFS family permease
MWSAAASIAAAIGPSIGGTLIELFGWRSVFVINVPIGILLLAGTRIVRPSARRAGERPDALGTLALAGGIGGLVLAVTEGSTWRWASPRTLGLLAAGLLLTAVALWRSAHHPVPAIQTTLWRSKTFALANVVSLFFGAALYAYLLCGALFLVNVWHYSELTTGFALSPGAVLAATAAIGFGRMTGRWRDPRVAVVGGSLLVVSTTAALCIWLPAKPHFLALWLPTVLIGGFGVGAISTGVSSAAALSVQPPQFASATGLNMAARQFGGALGVGVLAALLAAAQPTRPGPYVHILLFCTITIAIAGVAGLGLSLRPATAPATQTSLAATDARA